MKFQSLIPVLRIVVLALFPTVVAAQVPQKLVLVFKDGQRQTFNLADLARIEFVDGGMPASTQNPPSGRGPGRWSESEGAFRGNWTTLTASQLEGGAARRTSTPGDSVTFVFHGRSVSLVSKIQPDAGVAQIYLDDQLVMEHAQFTGDNHWEDQKLVLIKSGLDPSRTHTLRIVHSGRSNPYGKPAWVTVDGFVVQ